MNPVNNATPCLFISKESKKIKLKENDWLGLIPQCTEVQFSSFFSGGFITIIVKFIYSEKATKFCEILPLHLTVCTVVKSKGKISQNLVAFSEYMNFIKDKKIHTSRKKYFCKNLSVDGTTTK